MARPGNLLLKERGCVLGRDYQHRERLVHDDDKTDTPAHFIRILSMVFPLSLSSSSGPRGRSGSRDQALAWLDKAYAERSDYMPYITLEPMLDGLRSDPRFAVLVRRVGLPTR